MYKVMIKIFKVV